MDVKEFLQNLKERKDTNIKYVVVVNGERICRVDNEEEAWDIALGYQNDDSGYYGMFPDVNVITEYDEELEESQSQEISSIMSNLKNKYGNDIVKYMDEFVKLPDNSKEVWKNGYTILSDDDLKNYETPEQAYDRQITKSGYNIPFDKANISLRRNDGKTYAYKLPFIDYSDIIYTERGWNEFVKWVKETKGVDYTTKYTDTFDDLLKEGIHHINPFDWKEPDEPYIEMSTYDFNQALTYEGEDEPDISWLIQNHNIDIDKHDHETYIFGDYEDLQKFIDYYMLSDYGVEITLPKNENLKEYLEVQNQHNKHKDIRKISKQDLIKATIDELNEPQDDLDFFVKQKLIKSVDDFEKANKKELAKKMVNDKAPYVVMLDKDNDFAVDLSAVKHLDENKNINQSSKGLNKSKKAKIKENFGEYEELIKNAKSEDDIINNIHSYEELQKVIDELDYYIERLEIKISSLEYDHEYNYIHKRGYTMLQDDGRTPSKYVESRIEELKEKLEKRKDILEELKEYTADDFEEFNENLNEVKEDKQVTYVWKKDGDDHILTERGKNKALITLSRMNNYFPWTIYKGNKKITLDNDSDKLSDIKSYILNNVDKILGKKLKESDDDFLKPMLLSDTLERQPFISFAYEDQDGSTIVTTSWETTPRKAHRDYLSTCQMKTVKDNYNVSVLRQESRDNNKEFAYVMRLTPKKVNENLKEADDKYFSSKPSNDIKIKKFVREYADEIKDDIDNDRYDDYSMWSKYLDMFTMDFPKNKLTTSEFAIKFFNEINKKFGSNFHYGYTKENLKEAKGKLDDALPEIKEYINEYKDKIIEYGEALKQGNVKNPNYKNYTTRFVFDIFYFLKNRGFNIYKYVDENDLQDKYIETLMKKALSDCGVKIVKEED